VRVRKLKRGIKGEEDKMEKRGEVLGRKVEGLE